MIDLDLSSRYMTFMRIASALIQKHQMEKETKSVGEESANEEAQQQTAEEARAVKSTEGKTVGGTEEDPTSVDELSTRVIAETNRIMGGNALRSSSGDGDSNELDIRFNPDCYSTLGKHAPEEDLTAQRKLVADAAEFLLVG